MYTNKHKWYVWVAILFVDDAVKFIEKIQYDLIKEIKDFYPEVNPISFEQIE